MSLKSDEFFTNEFHTSNIKKKATHGGLITVCSQALIFIFTLLSTAILARLITPDDFGLIGMILVIINFLAVFKDAGLAQATIQRKTINQSEVSNLFWVNSLIALILAIIIFLFAPLIAAFYGREELVQITRALSVLILIQGLFIQHKSLLSRKMEFANLAKVETGSVFCGLVVSAILALKGFSYWALVGQMATIVVCNLIGYLFFCQWVPSLPDLKISIRPYLKYGGNLAGFNFLNFFSRNADNVMIGYFLGATPLGLYSKAYSLLMLPLNQINFPITKVMLPILSQLQDDLKAYRDYYLKAINIAISLTFPLVGLFCVCAEDIILIILGEQWLMAIPVFQALVPAAFVSALNVTTGWVFQSLGTTDRQLKWTLFAAPLHVIFMLVGLQWGIVGVAWGISLSFCLIRIPYLAYSYKGTSIKLYDTLKIVFKNLIPVILSINFTLILSSSLIIQNIFFSLFTNLFMYLALIFIIDFYFSKKTGIFKSVLELKNYFFK